uniref:Putative secreted peptide n=1 Tax=Anopheles braziliensis TaxID=58242 RepID=A0A2M3ZUR3_9DIPT
MWLAEVPVAALVAALDELLLARLPPLPSSMLFARKIGDTLCLLRCGERLFRSKCSTELIFSSFLLPSR